MSAPDTLERRLLLILNGMDWGTDVPHLAETTGSTEDEVNTALDVLASLGLVSVLDPPAIGEGAVSLIGPGWQLADRLMSTPIPDQQEKQ